MKSKPIIAAAVAVAALLTAATAAEWKPRQKFTIPTEAGDAAAAFLDATTLIVALPGEPPTIAFFSVRPQGEPDPNPGPQPQPKPNPTPQGPLTILWIEETADRTPAQAAAITDRAIRDALAAAQWSLRVADVDVTDESGNPPAELAPYIAAARNRGLPALFAISHTGSEIFAGAAPQDVNAFRSLLAKLGLPLAAPAKNPEAGSDRPEPQPPPTNTPNAAENPSCSTTNSLRPRTQK